MLSNFQNGQDALLQTFLVGQPEFREILQSPGMLQLRQRVIATCHLGPLDAEETREYILHRLKCAGAGEKPTFDDEIFDTVYQFTGGVPRRINTLMDRVLLQGFLADKSHIDTELVNEIIHEVQTEMQVPAKTLPPWNAPVRAAAGSVARDGSVDAELNMDALELDAEVADGISDQLMQMTIEQLRAHLLRIERSVLRQERASLEILMTLQKLVAASRRPRSDNGVSSKG
jgi:hypothetical protein